ncbi:MAG: antibiotic ABC transporter ATP-binding protein [Legionellales bacterium RIFCSPHIGHO2_12_FULL_37_14]|nr:MAG: antibiotic ABC transporter ATP-binding protein [Legionellales bacterium RIFCSPHIGHO2_12_FULL_37_14]
MMHKPIQFKNICFSLSHKLCFEQFNETISYGQRIAIIGQNGSGKSTLLRMLQGLIEPTDGELVIPHDLIMGYVPQLIDELEILSGGQRFNEKLTQAMAGFPNILLLDEPTNHLDRKNRQSLMRMLRSFEGTLIIVTHDVELLSQTVDTIWHIDQGKICVFTGSYEDYRRELAIQYQSIEQELSQLSRQKKDAHRKLMKEQTRAKNSRIGGEKKIENRKWPTVGSAAKMGRANETSNRKKSEISHKKQVLTEQMSVLRLPEIIKPTFSIQASESGRVLVSISDGSVGFESPILTAINLSVTTGERIAISGDNGSGKSTLIRAILGDTTIAKTGSWQVLRREGIGYLDQHYSTLDVQKTVLDIMQDVVSNWSHAEIRRHLNDFLFRKNEEINATVSNLSGGEKVRLSLAVIAAITPKLLILDEITNNLDLETRSHVIQVLQDYPEAIVVISHDADFLAAIQITAHYFIHNGVLEPIIEGL